MFYYPEFLKNLDFVNIQVIFPGGWGQEIESDRSLHFLLEHVLFSPTPETKDPDAWLWENVLDFWSISSYESTRLNFTLKAEKVQEFTPFLKALITPREISESFLASELESLKNFWQAQRDKKEDEVLRTLFGIENVVHPNPKVVDNLSLEDYESVMKLWREKEPYLIICGALETDDLAVLSSVEGHQKKFVEAEKYQKPSACKTFTHPQRLGWKIKVPTSHIYELILIELWDQVFQAKFFFEYHKNKMYVWTDSIEYPHLLQKKIEEFIPTKNQFAKAKHGYLNFLEKIYVPQNHQDMEKFSELIEGLHGHDFQAPTYPISALDLDLRKTLSTVKYEDFLDFYKSFWDI